MCIENNAFYILQTIEDKMVKLVPLSEEDKSFLAKHNMRERIDAHNSYINAFEDLKNTEDHYRKQYGDDLIDKLMRGMPLS